MACFSSDVGSGFVSAAGAGVPGFWTTLPFDFFTSALVITFVVLVFRFDFASFDASTSAVVSLCRAAITNARRRSFISGRNDLRVVVHTARHPRGHRRHSVAHATRHAVPPMIPRLRAG